MLLWMMKPFFYTLSNKGRNFTTPIEGIATGEVWDFAVQKKALNPELIEMFNNGLAAIVKDGTYDKIINKYLDNNKSKEGSSKKSYR